MKNVIKKIASIAMAFTLLGTGTAVTKTISPKSDNLLTASAACQYHDGSTTINGRKISNGTEKNGVRTCNCCGKVTKKTYSITYSVHFFGSGIRKNNFKVTDESTGKVIYEGEITNEIERFTEKKVATCWITKHYGFDVLVPEELNLEGKGIDVAHRKDGTYTVKRTVYFK